MVNFNSLNAHEKPQYLDLVQRIRMDPPLLPRPARDHIPLVRERVTVALNYSIDNGLLPDIHVDRSKIDGTNKYFHT